MIRRRLAAPLVALAIIVSASAGWALGLFGGAADGALRLSGNVDIRQVDLGFRVGGRIAAIAFEEGARVPAGAVLAQLDPAPMADGLTGAEAQVALAEAELAKRRNGNRPQEIGQASAALAEAQAALVNARADHDRVAALLKTGFASRALHDQTEAAWRSAQARATQAREALSLQRAGWRAEDVAAAAAERAAAAARRDQARTDLADAALRAPNAGTLLTRAREPGAIVQPGETVLTLTIDRPMRVRAYVGEPDLTRISPGMAVHVAADGNPKRYRGIIGHISPTAEFTPKTVQTEDLRTDLVYRLRIIVTDPDDGLRQGAPVTVTVPDARPATRG